MITVGIIEDDADIREGIQKFLSHQKDFTCDDVFGSVEEFLTFVKEHPFPDVMLMDIVLPGMSGIDGMRFVKERSPETDIIMLTVYTDWQKIFDSLCAGASGYLLKNTPLSELRKSIETVRAGGSVMSPEIARKVTEYFTPKKERTVASPLTPKEREIVVGLVDGLSYKMIADRLDLSIDTIRFHIKNIYRKLHVNSKGEIISKSLKGEI